MGFDSENHGFSLHNRRFMSQERRKRHFAPSAKRETREGESECYAGYHHGVKCIKFTSKC